MSSASVPLTPELRNLIALVFADPEQAIAAAQALQKSEHHSLDLVRAVAAYNPMFAPEMVQLLRGEIIELLEAL